MTFHMVEPCRGTVGSGGENIAMPLLEGLAKATNGAISSQFLLNLRESESAESESSGKQASGIMGID
ncbi:unnamed protein product [Clonostachys rhizophaga]|uniref:Uncharacterized protein n=1 Tax=Clonostachys rhizophaga TaxID=160324 RepID=A0A9N9VTG0_9HYPO|nr:unnamed protein product [Clonostachys rhizophaga]